MFAAAGFQHPGRELLTAIFTNSVGYYPRSALDLERFYRTGLLDPETGVLKTHAGDSGRSIRPLLTDVEEYLCSRKTQASGENQKTPTRSRAEEKSVREARPRGPRRGTLNRYGESDRALFNEIEKIMHTEQKSANAAALRLARDGKISGHGSQESLAKRLAGRFMSWRDRPR
jgi:hypothetical protein